MQNLIKFRKQSSSKVRSLQDSYQSTILVNWTTPASALSEILEDHPLYLFKVEYLTNSRFAQRQTFLRDINNTREYLHPDWSKGLNQ